MHTMAQLQKVQYLNYNNLSSTSTVIAVIFCTLIIARIGDCVSGDSDNDNYNFFPYEGEGEGDNIVRRDITKLKTAADYNSALRFRGKHHDTTCVDDGSDSSDEIDGGGSRLCFNDHLARPVFVGNEYTPLAWNIEISPTTPSIGSDIVIPLDIAGLDIVGGTFYKRTLTNSSQIQEWLWQRTKDKEFNADWSLVVTWVDTIWGQAGVVPEPGTNSFQVVLTTDFKRSMTYVVMVYGGMDVVVEEGTSARIHIGGSVFHIPGSNSKSFRTQAIDSSNVGIPGLWVVKATTEGRSVHFHNTIESSNPPKMSCTPPKDYYELCPDETFSIDLQCEVERGADDVTPWPSVVIQGLFPGEDTIQPFHSVVTTTTTTTGHNNVHVFYFSFYPEESGRRTITFVAKSSLDSSVIAKSTHTLSVVVPPHTLLLYANGLIFDGTDDVIKTRVGQRLNMTCGVLKAGGTGSILSASLECDGDGERSTTTTHTTTNTKIASSSSLLSSTKTQPLSSLPLQRQHTYNDNNEEGNKNNTSSSFMVTHDTHGSACVCQLYGCYGEAVKVTIHVVE